VPENNHMRWEDLLVIAINLGVMIVIGIYCARKTRSADGYFLADRSVPGWVVSVSIMATIISSMTFLGFPGMTFKDDWRYVPAHVLYIIPALVGYFVFLPFFRRGHVRSAYEYLERRFGVWARVYGAVTFVLYHMFRVGIILYAVSLAIHQLTGFPIPTVVVGLGCLVAVYTIAGGLEAVIYTDFVQGIALMIGGFICLPIIANLLPGGWTQIFTEAWNDGKFAVGSTDLVFNEKTVWVITLIYQFEFLRLVGTDQAMVQRYLAMKTDRQARRGMALSTAFLIPVWVCFALIGTGLYVYYKHFPTHELEGVQPEEVFPHFLLTHVPAGVAGFVIAGMLAASMSTLDSSINASAATVTTDFYQRFRPSAGDQRHYLRVGRAVSMFFAVVMIGVALLVHYAQTAEGGTLMDLQTVVYPVVSTGILSLFLLGFLTRRVGSTAALIATAATLVLVAAWVYLNSVAGRESFPKLAGWLPDIFWLGVVPTVFLLAVGYLLGLAFPSPPEERLKDLTIWSGRRNQVQ
jgi:SSS family solute:Na+ symporter